MDWMASVASDVAVENALEKRIIDQIKQEYLINIKEIQLLFTI